MALSRALIVAFVAGAALVVSIGLDAAMNRSWTVDVQSRDGWTTVATTGQIVEERVAKTIGPNAVEASRNGTIHMRVTIDNGYAWSYSETYRVLGPSGAEIARGTLEAPARGMGVATFDVPARLAFEPSSPDPKPVGGGALSLRVVLPHEDLFVYLTVQEVSA